jgi:hypothetical protein
MAESHSPEAFREALYSHKHTVLQLRRKLERLPVSQRSEALLAVFADQTRTETAYLDQETAGKLLLSLVPEPRQSLEEILRSAAGNWNLSVEQLPFYLRDVFGRSAVAEAAQRLAQTYPPESREARALLTICWWLRG